VYSGYNKLSTARAQAYWRVTGAQPDHFSSLLSNSRYSGRVLVFPASSFNIEQKFNRTQAIIEADDRCEAIKLFNNNNVHNDPNDPNGATMNVKFRFKVNSSNSLTYHFEKDEYRRFRTDYEGYILFGSPKGGLYFCGPVVEAGEGLIANELIIDFASISFVDIQVHMGKLNELRRQTQEVKQNAFHQSANVLN
jgi:hypothetical protein